MPHRNSELIECNTALLRQALDLVRALDDAVFASAPASLSGHRVGGHLRHILEFYECFLDGIQCSRIDYDARRRDAAVEKHRSSAMERIESLIHRFDSSLRLREDTPLLVRMEDAPLDDDHSVDPWLPTSVRRELQALSSHTIHQLALIAVTLTAHGFQVDPEFGMSPATLRFNRARMNAAIAA